MRKSTIYIFCFIFPLLNFNAAKEEEPWQLKKDESGVTVYTRDVKDSKFKELKSDVQVKTSLSSVIALLSDCDSYTQWVYRCGASKILKKNSETDYIHYQTLLAPWPVDDRDFIINVKVTQDPVSKVVYQKATSIPDFISVESHFVRIKEFKSVWTITPLKNGFVNVGYQLLVDPGGNIPAWLVNLAVVDGPFQTAFHLKTWVMKEKYQKAIIPYITESR